MVTNVTNLSRSGLYDWMIQRVSAVLLGVYFLFLLSFLILHPNLTFEQWHALFANQAMKIFSLLALGSIILHAWVGMWTITTDYLTTMALGRYATAVRFFVQAGCGIVQFVIFVWGIEIIWGVQNVGA